MQAIRRPWTGVAVAALLWFYMFSPWTAHITNFWLNMSISAVILTMTATCGRPWSIFPLPEFRRIVFNVTAGVIIAFALWGIFWVGDKLSQLMFDFARTEVDGVYAMKDGTSGCLVAALLLCIVGPAEEYFWRGYVQRTLSGRMGGTKAFIITTIVYALVHIWSFNFMLVMAALVAGAVWGVLYRIRPSLLPALIVSHALWDALVFVILPI